MKTRSRFLGTDRHGFRYERRSDNYVYQWYPDTDIFRNGVNMRGKPNGWICSFLMWERTLHRLIEVAP